MNPHETSFLSKVEPPIAKSAIGALTDEVSGGQTRSSIPPGLAACKTTYVSSVGRALGDILPLAVAVAIFPVPIIVAVLVLGSDRGTAKGAAYALSWCIGLFAVGGIVLLLAGAADASDDNGEPATWVNVLLLGLGLLLLAAAVRQWRGRPSGGQETPTPGWMRAIDEFTIAKAGGVGFALSALNPKNVLLTVAAGAEIAEVGLSAGREVAVLLAFVLIASAGVLTPLVLALALGQRSGELLESLRGWMARYSAVIMSLLCLIIGAKLIGDALSGFSS
jgi:threonine/homoserine/homoserine lactone efflux protein